MRSWLYRALVGFTLAAGVPTLTGCDLDDIEEIFDDIGDDDFFDDDCGDDFFDDCDDCDDCGGDDWDDFLDDLEDLFD